MDSTNLNFWEGTLADYVQAFAAFLAVVLAFVAFKLTVKDIRRKGKDVQSQIDGLVKLTNEMKEQTEFEKRKRKSDIAPIFRYEGGGTSPSEMKINILNVGGIAKILEINKEDSELFIKSSPSTSESLQNDKYLSISITTLTKNLVNNANFFIVLKYCDIDRNVYIQKIKIQNGKVKIDEPEEVKI